MGNNESVIEIVKKGIQKSGKTIQDAYKLKRELEARKPDKENLSVYFLIHNLETKKTWKYMRPLIAFLQNKGPFWYSKRPLFYEKLGKALVDMNNQSVDGLEEVYRLTTYWPQDDDINYPKYSELKTDNQQDIRAQSVNQTLRKKYFITDEQAKEYKDSTQGKKKGDSKSKCGLKREPQGTHTNEARIAAWAIPMPVKYGSKTSLDMLKSLEKCKNNEIFKIPILQGYLNYKWDQSRWFLFVQALLHIMYLIAFNTYSVSVSSRDSFGLQIFILVMTGIFVGREILQVFGRGKTYFIDPWNYPDLGMVVCVILAVLRDQIDPDKQLRSQWLFVVAVLLQWTRAISYFRLWHKTRHLIRSITETFYDMVPFILIVMVVIFAYSAAYICTYPKSQIDQFTYNGRMFEAYSIILGNPSHMNHNAPAYFLYVIISLSGLIILLNMLIALMGDTFGRVQENKIVYDYRERLSVNIDLESLMYICNRNKTKFVHIGVIRRPGGFESNTEWEGSMTEVKKVVRKGVEDTKKQIIKMQSILSQKGN